MSLEFTTDELEIYNEVSQLGALLWDASLKVEGLNTDPKMLSIMLFKRLWSNHRGFTLLWNNGLTLEADIVLRSGVEVAICIAANFRLRDQFVQLMRQDAAATLQGQIKLQRDAGETEMVSDGEAVLRLLQGSFPKGKKAQRLDWKDLAHQGDVPQLYGFHRMLSGVSSHVTGFSLLRGVTSDGLEDLQEELGAHLKKMHPLMMVGATLQGSMLHASMIHDEEKVQVALSLIDRLSAASMHWPRVEP